VPLGWVALFAHGGRIESIRAPVESCPSRSAMKLLSFARRSLGEPRGALTSYKAAVRAGALSSRNARSRFTEPSAGVCPGYPRFVGAAAPCPLPPSERALPSQQDASLSRAKSAESAPSSIIRQESRGGSGHRDFSVVVSLFLRHRKHRKIGANVQRLYSVRVLDTWVNENQPEDGPGRTAGTITFSPAGRWGRGGP
jgi:hypothetical protein